MWSWAGAAGVGAETRVGAEAVAGAEAEGGAEAGVGAGKEETQEHLLFRSGYAHLHERLDVYGERDRIRYYLKVQNEREKIGYGS